MFYKFITGIKNLIHYLPLIWTDRQWDQYYLYKMLRQKLILMEKFWYSDEPWSAEQDKVAKKVKLCRLLCDRIINDNYLMNALILVEEKYGELKFHWEKDDTLKGYSKLIWDESPEETKARIKAYNHSNYMEEQDRKMLFNILDKYIDRFWD